MIMFKVEMEIAQVDRGKFANRATVPYIFQAKNSTGAMGIMLGWLEMQATVLVSRGISIVGLRMYPTWSDKLTEMGDLRIFSWTMEDGEPLLTALERFDGKDVEKKRTEEESFGERTMSYYGGQMSVG